jgi:hypothetical protein
MSLTGGDQAGRTRAARHALAVALAGCGVLGLQSLPAASAAKGVKGAGGSTTVTSASEGSSAGTRRAERAAGKAEGAPPPQSPAPPATEAPKAGPDAGAGAPPHKSGAAAAAHAQRREERREARRSGNSTSTSLTASSTTASGSSAKPAVTIAGGQSSDGTAEALAHKQKKGTGGGQKGKKEHKGKKAPQEEGSGTEGSGSEGSGAEGASGPSAKPKEGPVTAEATARASAVAASLVPPAVLPPAETAPAATGTATPLVKAVHSGVNAAKHKRRGAGRAHKRAAATAAAATPSAPLFATRSNAGAAPATHLKRAAAKRSRPSSQTALVKTLTKIVGVVPTPVRILIGGLILLALMLGVRSLFSGARTRRLMRQRGQLLEDVGLLQAALLPEPPARLGPVATSVAYRPADGPGAGGDFYDVFALDGGEIAVIVGDVSGHGREALPHTALVRFTVRAYLEAGLSPRKALQTAGNVLDRQLAGSFATVIAATYNPRERKLTYASAGHPPPVMLGEQGPARALVPVTSCSAPPVGAGMPTGTRQTVVSVAGPTRLCFHTDGVTEARVDGQLFGAERLAGALSDLDRDADASALLDRVSELSDARPDDMAACLLRVHDGHGAPAIALEQVELSRELLADGRVERFLLDCGVERRRAGSIVDDARRRLQGTDSVMLELVPDAPGQPIVSLIDDNVIRAAALAAPGASQVAMTR